MLLCGRRQARSQRLSAVTPLLPGDLIFTGTPAGVGLARNPPRVPRAGRRRRLLHRRDRRDPDGHRRRRVSPRVTLTFDNGPTPGVTEGVLQTLQEHGAPATFFVVGRELERDGVRALAERAVAEGHRVGNHTLTHTVLLGACDDPALPEREIGGAQRLLGDACGERAAVPPVRRRGHSRPAAARPARRRLPRGGRLHLRALEQRAAGLGATPTAGSRRAWPTSPRRTGRSRCCTTRRRARCATSRASSTSSSGPAPPSARTSPTAACRSAAACERRRSTT